MANLPQTTNFPQNLPCILLPISHNFACWSIFGESMSYYCAYLNSWLPTGCLEMSCFHPKSILPFLFHVYEHLKWMRLNRYPLSIRRSWLLQHVIHITIRNMNFWLHPNFLTDVSCRVFLLHSLKARSHKSDIAIIVLSIFPRGPKHHIYRTGMGFHSLWFSFRIYRFEVLFHRRGEERTSNIFVLY